MVKAKVFVVDKEYQAKHKVSSGTRLIRKRTRL